MKNFKDLNESDNRIVGNTISFIDIDETTFHTYAKVKVMKDGKIVRTLNNQEFNTYSLKDGEYYNFDEFADSDIFNKTSEPIESTIQRIQRMVSSIKRNDKLEKIIFLTARKDFNDKDLFLKTFRSNGIDVDIKNVYIERSGNLAELSNVAERKRFIILKYLKTGYYTAVRMIDDDLHNLEVFKELGKEINEGKYGIINTVLQRFPRIRKIFFYPLLVNENGRLKRL